MEPGEEVIYNYWGKAGRGDDADRYHLLVYHSLDVAAVGNVILQKDPLLMRWLSERTPISSESLPSVICFFLALHDIGKFSERFQNLRGDLLYLLQGKQTQKEYILRHDEMGKSLIDDIIWEEAWEQNWLGLDQSDTYYDSLDWKWAWSSWFSAICGHHGRPPAQNGKSSGYFSDADQNASGIFAEKCAEFFLNPAPHDPLTGSDDLEKSLADSSWLLAGLAVLSDWIGSGSDFGFIKEPMPLEKYWADYALPRAEEAVLSSGVAPCTISDKTGFNSLFPDFTATPLQAMVSEHPLSTGPQLVIIEEATGSGKTEAAITLSHRIMAEHGAEGIFFGLPTMATSNAMYGRLAKIYGRIFAPGEHPWIVLAHSASHLNTGFQESLYRDTQGSYGSDEQTASAACTAWLADNRKKSLLATVGVGTIDQALMSVLPYRHQSLRLLGLSRHVLVVDEVHAYDPYMNELLRKLLEFHATLGGSAILLSATLPEHQRQKLVDSYAKGLGTNSSRIEKNEFPLITRVSSDGVDEIPSSTCERTHRTVGVQIFSSLDQVHTYLRNAVATGRCACWVRNTVDDAVDAYTDLASEFGEEKITLFHARFAMGDRNRIEKYVTSIFGPDSSDEDRKGRILIATQVVEQSLDLDFDFMVSDLAPMDLIIQRAGRLHRNKEKHPGRGEPVLGVFSPPFTDNPDKDWYQRFFPGGGYVYPNHGQLWLTAKLLSEQKQIIMPDEARFLIEGVFSKIAEKSIPESLMWHELRSEGKAQADRSLAALNALNVSEGYKSSDLHWQEESRTPTRLGDDSITLYLACWQDGKLTPWSSSEKNPWDSSRLSIRESKISSSAEYDAALKAAIEETKSTLPDKGLWSLILPLISVDRKLWKGHAKNRGGDDVQVLYDTNVGLRILKD